MIFHSLTLIPSLILFKKRLKNDYKLRSCKLNTTALLIQNPPLVIVCRFESDSRYQNS
jgi:hypothetical protein